MTISENTVKEWNKETEIRNTHHGHCTGTFESGSYKDCDCPVGELLKDKERLDKLEALLESGGDASIWYDSEFGIQDDASDTFYGNNIREAIDEIL